MYSSNVLYVDENHISKTLFYKVCCYKMFVIYVDILAEMVGKREWQTENKHCILY